MDYYYFSISIVLKYYKYNYSVKKLEHIRYSWGLNINFIFQTIKNTIEPL